MQTNTVPVLTARLPEARAALDKLVRRAKRLGVAGVGYTVGDEYTVERKIGDYFRPRKVNISYTNLEVSTEPLKVGDYAFVARLEVTPSGTLVDGVPGVALEPRWMHWGGDCEHCKVSRVRRHLFVVADTAGRQIAVGRSCLRAFLGMDTPSSIAAHFAFWAEVTGGEFGGFGKAPYMVPVMEILSLTATAVRLHGWCSVSAAETSGGEATAVRVACYLGPRPRPTRDQYGVPDDSAGQDWDAAHAARSDADEEVAQKVYEYVRDGLAATSSYAHNLKVLFHAGAILEPKRLRIVVSAYGTWARTQERPAAAPQVMSEWVGEVGARLRNLEAIFEGSVVIGSNEFGDVVLNRFRTTTGDRLKWFSGRSVRLPDGTPVRLTGTVKKHDSYNGQRETLLSRCIVQN